MALHEIPLERRTLHGHFSRDLDPILTVDSGDSIAFACLELRLAHRRARGVPGAVTTSSTPGTR